MPECNVEYKWPSKVRSLFLLERSALCLSVCLRITTSRLRLEILNQPTVKKAERGVRNGFYLPFFSKWWLLWGLFRSHGRQATSTVHRTTKFWCMSIITLPQKINMTVTKNETDKNWSLLVTRLLKDKWFYFIICR